MAYKRGTDWASKCEPIGKLKYYHSGIKQSLGYPYTNKLKAAKKGISSKLTVSDFKWMNKLEALDGSALPPDRTLMKLLVKGLAKIELTEEGKEMAENEGKGKIMMDVLHKTGL